jgi:peptide/nickel transport system permease protein
MTDTVTAAEVSTPVALQTTRRTRGDGGRVGLPTLIASRLLSGVLTLVILSIIVFAATQALPGDAAKQVLGPNATPQQVAALRQQLGLDQSRVTQYWHWITGVLRGDFGHSLTTGESVSSMLDGRFLNSVTLLAFAALVSIPLSLSIGIRAAIRRDRAFDTVTSLITLVLAALPEFVIGLGLVVLFATGVLHVAKPVSLVDPTVPLVDQLGVLVLPAATLIIATVPYIARMTRSSFIEVLESEYIETARLNGISERRVIFRHAMRNAIAPIAQVIALTLAYLAGGVVVVEAVFNYPGIGTALVSAVRYRDLPVVQLISLVIGAVYIVCNLAADVIGILATPRLRAAR